MNPILTDFLASNPDMSFAGFIWAFSWRTAVFGLTIQLVFACFLLIIEKITD